MRLRLYCVLDKAVQAYNPPLCFRSEGEAMRSFLDAVLDTKTAFAKHKDDYAFCFLGYYDDGLGAFETTAPLVIAEAATIVAAYGSVELPEVDVPWRKEV